jgi:hypothetical protein
MSSKQALGQGGWLDRIVGSAEVEGAMADWLVLLNEHVNTEDTVTALRAAVPPPWDRLVLLGVGRRWRPLTSGVPISYRGEARAALRQVWSEQEEELRTRLEAVAGRLSQDTQHVDVRLVWGDPVDGAHQMARAGQACMIVYPLRPSRWALDYLPGSLPWRLVRNAPCAVLLARIPTGHERALASEGRPALFSTLAR